jgi:hypothetical protein
VENTKPLAARSDNLLQRLRFDLVSALSRSAAGHPEAHQQLQQLVSTARSREFIPLEFEIRIEIAKLKQRARDNSSTGDLNAVRILAAERNLNRIVKLCDAAPHSTRQNWL